MQLLPLQDLQSVQRRCAYLLGELDLQPNFQKGGGGGSLTGSQFLDGCCWERGGDIFLGDCSFYIRNKLKSEIFNDKFWGVH